MDGLTETSRCSTPNGDVGGNGDATLKLKLESKEEASGQYTGCEMCRNYEMQLQSVQQHEDELRNQLAKSQHIMQNFKDDLRKEHNSRLELEEKFKKDSETMDDQLRELDDKLSTNEAQLFEMKEMFEELSKDSHDKISQLNNNKEDLCREVVRLSRENDALLGRNIAKSRDMQSQNINLPEDLNELHFYLLKLQEELITTLVAKERNEETQRSELLFLEDQVKGEIQSKDKLIEELTLENDALRTEVEKLSSQVDKEGKHMKEQEEILAQCNEKIASLITDNDRTTTDLKWQVGQLTDVKNKLDEELMSLRNKVQSMQIDIDNSEAVQRDFVKLSQSLQIQLEKIRQADSEVRWQHEDDVTDCNNCKRKLNSKRDKLHCAHCGRIFCPDCNTKIIYSGPRKRAFKVCVVCHTLLDHETAPYFSNEPPQSPN